MSLSFYFGDKFQVNEAIKERKFKISSNKYEQINVQSIQWRDISIKQFFHICNAIPFGTDIQIIIIAIDFLTSKANRKNIKSWDDNLDLILQRSSEIPKHSEVIFDFSPEFPSKNILGKLTNFVNVYTFEILKGQKLLDWCAKRTRDKGLNLDQKILKELSYFNRNDLWKLDNEIEKLALFLEVSDSQEKKNISDLIFQDREVKIFELVDCLIKGDKLRSLILGGKLYQEGYSFMYVLMVLSREIKLLILAKLYLEIGFTGNNIGKKLRIYHPFRVRKILEQLHQTSIQNLQLIYRGLSNMELGIKKGNYTEKQVLESIMAFASEI